MVVFTWPNCTYIRKPVRSLWNVLTRHGLYGLKSPQNTDTQMAELLIHWSADNKCIYSIEASHQLFSHSTSHPGQHDRMTGGWVGGAWKTLKLATRTTALPTSCAPPHPHPHLASWYQQSSNIKHERNCGWGTPAQPASDKRMYTFCVRFYTFKSDRHGLVLNDLVSELHWLSSYLHTQTTANSSWERMSLHWHVTGHRTASGRESLE